MKLSNIFNSTTRHLVAIAGGALTGVVGVQGIDALYGHFFPAPNLAYAFAMAALPFALIYMSVKQFEKNPLQSLCNASFVWGTAAGAAVQAIPLNIYAPIMLF